MTQSRKKREASSPDALELIVSWISGVLFLALLVFLVWDARQPLEPPSFQTAIESRAERGTSTYLTVAVKNLGDEAAQAVEVRVAPVAGNSETEGHFTLEWLPGNSIRRGVAILPRNVADVRAEVVGYSKP